MTIEEFIESIIKEYGDSVTTHKIMSRMSATYYDHEKLLSSEFRDVLNSFNIEKLYSHQGLAVEKVMDGKNVITMTPTASGKSLIYNTPVIEDILKNPKTKALYIFPLKGLEQDQLGTLKKFEKKLKLKNLASVYDGDTNSYQRGKIRTKHPNIILTNPDMIHAGILPFHNLWEEYFRNLKYIIIDEVHTYRGVFGSHMACLLRRLLRIAKLYGSHPQFICSSATINNSLELCTMLTGKDFELISDSGAPEGVKHFLFIDPPEKESPNTIATALFKDSINNGFRSIAFTKARKVTELMYKWVKSDKNFDSTKVSAYRAGFLPSERRDIEEKLFSGEFKGVISTSALELGIDIGGLDVCILNGYPGTITQTLQRAGRVGRSEQNSLVILVANNNQLDKHFIRHSDDFFDSDVEGASVDIFNEPICKAHLQCAVVEDRLRIDDEFFDIEELTPYLKDLEKDRKLRFMRRDGFWYQARVKNIHKDVSLRGNGERFQIIDSFGKLIGESTFARSLKELHPGAIYFHKGNQYKVKKLDLGEKKATIIESVEPYYTTPISEEESSIINSIKNKDIGKVNITFGSLRINEEIMGYRKKELFDGKTISEHYFELPPEEFNTKGIWMTVSEDILCDVKEQGFSVTGSLHALEHAAIAVLPMFTMCDRNDLGGRSYEFNEELQSPAIFIFDSIEGGIGICEKGYDVIYDWFDTTRLVMEECKCKVACPSCTQDPHCGNNNEPLDKRGAIYILRRWLGLY